MESGKVKFSGRTHKGLVRDINQDSFRILELPDKNKSETVIILADGMGGHNAGEVASALAVDYAAQQAKETNLFCGDCTSNIIRIMDGANSLVFDKSQEDITHVGMGTTMIITAISDDEMFIGHIGDSRVYLLRNGEFSRVTTDHSLVEELVMSGAITRSEAENHPRKNVITKVLGCEPEISIDTYNRKLLKGDRVLICTDGLTNMVRESEITQILTDKDNPEEAIDILIDRANEYGGEDNVTAIAVYF
ncbi:MAG: Stp1/IreP family PP2C-type Ser/Thr phosphatase [Eubacteriales bacterium]|nr:Stp1/IreP family PP2C-type Ser/Thr phosphatase [Eubacteriales bacterium]